MKKFLFFASLPVFLLSIAVLPHTIAQEPVHPIAYAEQMPQQYREHWHSFNTIHTYYQLMSWQNKNKKQAYRTAYQILEKREETFLDFWERQKKIERYKPNSFEYFSQDDKYSVSFTEVHLKKDGSKTLSSQSFSVRQYYDITPEGKITLLNREIHPSQDDLMDHHRDTHVRVRTDSNKTSRLVLQQGKTAQIINTKYGDADQAFSSNTPHKRKNFGGYAQVLLSPQARYLAYKWWGWEIHGVKIYDIHNQQYLHIDGREFGNDGPFSFGFTHDEKYFYSCSADHFSGAIGIQILDLAQQKKIYEVPHNNETQEPLYCTHNTNENLLYFGIGRSWASSQDERKSYLTVSHYAYDFESQSIFFISDTPRSEF